MQETIIEVLKKHIRAENILPEKFKHINTEGVENKFIVAITMIASYIVVLTNKDISVHSLAFARSTPLVEHVDETILGALINNVALIITDYTNLNSSVAHLLAHSCVINAYVNNTNNLVK
jgi:hypothetical protein